MHFTTTPSFLLSAALGAHQALAQPTVTPQNNTILLHHTPDGTALFPTNSSLSTSAVSPAAAPAAPRTKCITFYSDNPDWNYANTGIWGSASGPLGAQGRQICVPVNDRPGGAMYIGTERNPGPGNTKLEIKFPTSGTAYGDVSLVDGYSLSVQCLALVNKQFTRFFGGNGNLWTQGGNPCVDRSLLGRGICRNGKGYAPRQNDVTAFFQEGLKYGDLNCIWQFCPVPGWPAEAPVICHVSGGRP